MTDTANAARTIPAPELRIELRHWCEAWKPVCKICFLSFGKTRTFEFSTNPAAAIPISGTRSWPERHPGRNDLASAGCSCASLARKFLVKRRRETATEALSAESISAESKEALRTAAQVAGLAATALAPSAGGEVQLHLSASAGPPGPRTPSSASKRERSRSRLADRP